MAIRTVLCALLISGCAHQIAEYPQQPSLVTRSTITDAMIHVEFVADVDAVKRACAPHAFPYACSTVRFVGNAAVCTITAVEPRDFNDGALMALLGHEAWHCFGARHG